MDEMTDAQLVAFFGQTGDMRHMNILVSRHIGRVRGLLFDMLLSHEDADDLTQEVFLKAFSSLDGFDNRAQFSTWLYRIAVNTARDFMKSQEKKNAASSMAHEARPRNCSLTSADPLVTREVLSDVEGAIAALSPKLRSAIVLTAVEGVSIREAARIEKCLRATMHWRVHQARKLLRELLAEHLDPTQGG